MIRLLIFVFLLLLVVAITIMMVYMLRPPKRELLQEEFETFPGERSNGLRNIGIVMFGLGVGLLMSYLCARFLGFPEYIIIPGSLLMCGGVSLVFINYLDRMSRF